VRVNKEGEGEQDAKLAKRGDRSRGGSSYDNEVDRDPESNHSIDPAFNIFQKGNSSFSLQLRFVRVHPRFHSL
jgi:hypothetical protein